MEKNEDLRKNAKIALSAVADLPAGFHKITEQMAGKVDLLDEVINASLKIAVWIESSESTSRTSSFSRNFRRQSFQYQSSQTCQISSIDTHS